MTDALVVCSLGTLRVDLDDGSVTDAEDTDLAVIDAEVSLPLLVAADRVGARIVALVARRPPLLVSDDAGATWTELGGGLPPGVAVAISPEHPDDVVYASAERLFVSNDGGRFWAALAIELPEITAVAFAS